MKDFKNLLQGCTTGDRTCQKLLYQEWYNFAMGICLRYSACRDEAVMHLNIGFLLVYKQASSYNQSITFENWLKRIFIGIFIDHSRHKLKITAPPEYHHQSAPTRNILISTLKYQQLIVMIHKLSHELRTIFNMYVIDGYTHEDISAIFSITENHSKSILSKARTQLGQLIESTLTCP